MTETATPADWAQTITDKGYNATPLFSAVFGRVAAVVPIDRGRVRVLFLDV